MDGITLPTEQAVFDNTGTGLTVHASHDWRAVPDGLLAAATPYLDATGDDPPATVGPGVRLTVYDVSALGPLPPAAEGGALRGQVGAGTTRVATYLLDRPLAGVERFTIGVGDWTDRVVDPDGDVSTNLTVTTALADTVPGTGPIIHVAATGTMAAPVTRIKIGFDYEFAPYVGVPVVLDRLLGVGDRVALAIDVPSSEWWCELNGVELAGTRCGMVADGSDVRVECDGVEVASVSDEPVPLGPIPPLELSTLSGSSTPMNAMDTGWAGAGLWWAWSASDVNLDDVSVDWAAVRVLADGPRTALAALEARIAALETP